MAQAQRKNTKQKTTHKANAQKAKKTSVQWNFPLNKTDLIWLAIGIAVVAIGYLLMATGITEEPATPDGKWANPFAVNVAPVLLFIGYCVIIPLAIFKFFSLGISNIKKRRAAKHEVVKEDNLMQ